MLMAICQKNQVDFSVFRRKSYFYLFKNAEDAKYQKRSVLMVREQCIKVEEEWIKFHLLSLHLQCCNMGRSLGIDNKSGNSASSCLNLCTKEVIVVLINQLQPYEFQQWLYWSFMLNLSSTSLMQDYFMGFHTKN